MAVPCPKPLLQTLCLSNIMFARHQVAPVIPLVFRSKISAAQPPKKSRPNFGSILRTRFQLRQNYGEPPKTTFRSRVDGGSSVFGVDGFMAAHPSGCFFLTFAPSWLMGFGSYLVLIFVFQAAIRGSSFNRTICS